MVHVLQSAAQQSAHFQLVIYILFITLPNKGIELTGLNTHLCSRHSSRKENPIALCTANYISHTNKFTILSLTDSWTLPYFPSCRSGEVALYVISRLVQWVALIATVSFLNL